MPDFSIESIDFSSPWVLALIVLAAMLQDDLTCLIVGSAVVAGRISLVPAGAACWLGAWLGDIGWFLAARVLGQQLLDRWPLRRMVTADHLERARGLFDRLGPWTLFASRFLPLVRTPLQVTSGLLLRSAIPGCLLLLAAGGLYVSLVLGTVTAVGNTTVVRDLYDRYGTWTLLAVPLIAWIVLAGIRRLLRWNRPSD